MLLPRVLVGLAAGLALYTYLGYPAILKLLSLFRRPEEQAPLRYWPRVSIMVPVYNEAAVIAATLERILAVDYPADRRQILVVSDASTDASVRVHRDAVKHLVAAFADPAVGVASGRDVSVTNRESPANAGERAYVGYEMWVRDLETAVDGIVGASGCLYAIRANLHMHDVPEALSRDFAAALTARAHGQRAVSVPAAICYVPRGASLHQEYARKVRTITRGLGTLLYKRALLNPLRTGLFAWMLFSHKVCRWLLPWALLLFVAALATLAVTSSWARAALVAAAAVGVLAAAGWRWSERGRIPPPRLVTLAAYLVAGNVAVLHAWLRVVGGRLAPVWEPTRR